jgi:Tol biopolymer transport system component
VIRLIDAAETHVCSRPCFSPGGDRVLYMRTPNVPSVPVTDNGSPWELWSAPVAGGKAERAFSKPGVAATRPDWCRTTARIAMTAIRGGSAELWILDPAGDQARQMPVSASTPPRLFYPCWYPDGRRLVVTDYATNQVLEVDVDAGSVRTLTDPSRVLAGMAAAWCGPGGDRLAFAGQEPGNGFDPVRNVIWVQAPGEEPRPLDRLGGRMPAWSPDGQYLAFTAHRWRGVGSRVLRRWVPSGSTLHVQRMDGLEPVARPVAATGLRYLAAHGKWSPDGRTLACNLVRRPGGPAGIGIIDASRLTGSRGE